jgi:hypothetical protein
MNGRKVLKTATIGVAAAAAAAAAGYAALVVFHRARHGTVKGFAAAGKDSLLDRFLPRRSNAVDRLGDPGGARRA